MATIAPTQPSAIQLRHLPLDRRVSVLHRTAVAGLAIGAAGLAMCMLMLAIVLATPAPDLRSPFVPGAVPQPTAEYGLGL
jgi:hypothetical protein